MTDTTTALVTGANKGIGYAIADAQGIALDVTSDDSVTAAARVIGDRYGSLDVLVNNAGISGPFDPVTWGQDPRTLDLDVLRDVVDVNVYGVIRVTNAMLPFLSRSAHPRIVNASSSMGSMERRPGPIMAAYSPSKSFLNSVTVQYARAFENTPIIVNAACPGLVATDFNGFAGDRTPAQGAATAIRLAMLPDDGPRGGFFDDGGVVPW